MKLPLFFFLLLTLVSGTFCATAQISWNLNEWLRQKKTERKYTAQHIVQLQLYLGALKEGYKIANSGLQIINTIKNGEFNLHDLYYLSLKTIHPAIAAYPAAARSLDYQHRTRQVMEELMASLRQDTEIAPAQQSFLLEIALKIVEEATTQQQSLQQVIKDGALQMTHDERIKRMTDLLVESEKLYLFARNVRDDAVLVADGRRSQLLHGQTIRKLYDLQTSLP